MEISPNKKMKLDLEKPVVNNINVLDLPREVLCIIFSYLDKKSLRKATASCKCWFELIRSDIKLSGYICLENFGVEALFRKLAIGKWNWARWPVLKAIKFGGMSAAKIQNTSSKKMTSYISSESTLFCFKGCPTLEKVVISVSCTLTGIFPKFPNLPLGIIEELTFDPKDAIESIGIEHISRLKFLLDGSIRSEERFDTQAKITSQNLKLLKSTAHHLKSISIIGRDIAFINLLMPIFFGGMTQDLKNSFGQMFQQLDKTLESVHVIVSRICDIDHLFSDSTPITEIWIEKLDMQEKDIGSKLRHGIRQEININRLTKLFHRFKKLRKCRVNLEISEESEDQNCNTLPKFVEENFKDIADLKFRFVYCKKIVKKVQNEEIEVLRVGSPDLANEENTKIIRFEVTPQ